MTLLYGNRDRAKASEHAIFLLRELHVPAPIVAAALPRAAKRFTGLDVAHGASDWRFTLQTLSDDGPHDFFEGIIRFERASSDLTHVILVGRFAHTLYSPDSPEALNADYKLAEDDLIRIFDELLREVEASVAVPVS